LIDPQGAVVASGKKLRLTALFFVGLWNLANWILQFSAIQLCLCRDNRVAGFISPYGKLASEDDSPSSMREARCLHGREMIRLHLNSAMPNVRIRNTQELLTRTRQTRERIEQTGATFFLVDLDLAMTLTRIASSAPVGSEKRARNQANARQAYDEISRISRGTGLLNSERKDVDEKLAELRLALRTLGEQCD
jgi:hypothetical protein